MKKKQLIVIIFFASLGCMGQETVDSEKQMKPYELLCKAWGICKYFHPSASNGSINWDSVLLKKYEDLKSNPMDVDSIVTSMIIINNGEIDVDHYINSHDSLYVDSLYCSLCFENHSMSPNLTSMLKNLMLNNYDSLYYIQYEKPVGNTSTIMEKDAFSGLEMTEEIAVLAIFRYWNVINYFYPYKNIIPTDWNSQLSYSLKRLFLCKCELDYLQLLKELTAQICDSHSSFYCVRYYSNFVTKQLPFLLRFINDSLVIKDDFGLTSTNSILCKGDVILKLNNIPIDSIKAQKWNALSGSNENSKYTSLAFQLRWTTEDSVRVSYFSSGEIKETTIESVSNEDFFYLYTENKKKRDSISFITSNIGYINPEYLTIEMIPSVFEMFCDTKAIIFDLRNYPEFSMYEFLEYLPHESVPFFVSIVPTPNKPGSFYKRPSRTIGHRETELYHGKIVCLVDELSLSRSEFYVMALQISKNCVVIGTQTSGADGNVSLLKLPTNIQTKYSGIGIEYPDGGQCQLNGVRIDYYLNFQTQDWRKFEDPYLKKALDITNELIK